MVLALIAVLCLGCGKGPTREARVITIGLISDMTGPASSGLIPINYAVYDVVRYYNEQEPIPGVKIEVETWDSRYDPARDIPGYEWLRAKGAKLMYTPLPTSGEILKPFAERDMIPILVGTGTWPQIEPPAWNFCFYPPETYLIGTFLKWLSEDDWDYQANGRKPRIGSVGWAEPYASEVATAIKEYCQHHPDEFEYVGGSLVPMGQMSWVAEANSLKGCDYLFPPSTGMGTPTFIKEFRSRGYSAKFISTVAHMAFKNLLVDICGWDYLDGMLSMTPYRWWNEGDFFTVNLGKQLLHSYHPDKAAGIDNSGAGYIVTVPLVYCAMQIVRDAVNQVGAENFDGQAFYDQALKFKTTLDGYKEWNFTETKRYAPNNYGIYEWSAREQDIVRKVSDWIPLSQSNE
jgi:hypothetical protein